MSFETKSNYPTLTFYFCVRIDLSNSNIHEIEVKLVAIEPTNEVFQYGDRIYNCSNIGVLGKFANPRIDANNLEIIREAPTAAVRTPTTLRSKSESGRVALRCSLIANERRSAAAMPPVSPKLSSIGSKIRSSPLTSRAT